MNWKRSVKSCIVKTQIGKTVLAKQRIDRLVDNFRLSQKEVFQGLEDEQKQEELLERQANLFPKQWEKVNSRIDWIEQTPLNNGIDIVSLRTKMLFYYFAYGFAPSEFLAYNLLNKTPEEIKNYISDRESVRYAYRLNTVEAVDLFMDKNRTYEKFRKYYCRDAISIKASRDRKAYLSFIEKHPTFVKKEAEESCGRGIELFETKGSSQEEKDALFASFVSHGNIILEEPIAQSEIMAKINKSTVNTVRCFTLLTKDGVLIPWCWGKLGRAGHYVDNAAAGGLLAGIDVQTGEIMHDGCCDEFGRRYKTHPDNGFNIEEFRYPEWNEMINVCKEMAQQIPEAKWIGWDMAHTDSGWLVVEGNSVTEVIGPQSTLQKGIKREMDKYLQNVETIF